MTVLFLTHPEADYGEYFLYNGLCEVLGPDNVWDVPYKRSYHGEIHTYPGYERHTPNHRGWGLCGSGRGGVTAPFEYARSWPGQERGEQEVIGALRSGQVDLVVVGSPRIESRRYLSMLRPHLAGKRVVMHDGEDHSVIWQDVSREGVRLYLKRELLPGRQAHHALRVKPFPFSCPLEFKEGCDKSVDVLCAVGMTNPARGAAMAVVEQLPGANVLCGHWGWSRYIELIHLSKIAVAPRGHGQDTVRRWEIPAAETLLMCEKLDLVEDNPLRDGEHCVYYSGQDELRRKLLWWLEHEEERARVARAGMEFVRQHHTNAARARKMLDWVKEVYG